MESKTRAPRDSIELMGTFSTASLPKRSELDLPYRFAILATSPSIQLF